MSGAIPTLPNTSSMHGAQLKQRDKYSLNFTFTFTVWNVFQKHFHSVPHERIEKTVKLITVNKEVVKQ